MILRINEAELKYLRAVVAEDLKEFDNFPVADSHRWEGAYQTAKNLKARFVALERIRINNDRPEAKIIRARTI